jgi:hypothetical protein
MTVLGEEPGFRWRCEQTDVEAVVMDSQGTQEPLSFGTALRAVVRCVLTTAVLLAPGRIRLPRRHVGERLRFANGTSAWVYRETVVDRSDPVDPCVLVVEFRLRAVRGRGHAFFRWESILNTPLFVGFPRRRSCRAISRE